MENGLDYLPGVQGIGEEMNAAHHLRLYHWCHVTGYWFRGPFWQKCKHGRVLSHFKPGTAAYRRQHPSRQFSHHYGQHVVDGCARLLAGCHPGHGSTAVGAGLGVLAAVVIIGGWVLRKKAG